MTLNEAMYRYLSEKVGAFAHGSDNVEDGVSILRACRLSQLDVVVGGIQRRSDQLRHAGVHYDVTETAFNADLAVYYMVVNVLWSSFQIEDLLFVRSVLFC